MNTWNRLIFAFLLVATLAGCGTPNGTKASKTASADPPANEGLLGTPASIRPKWEDVDLIAARLDSLVALSSGDYIHMQIAPCFGKCDGFVSIFRESPARFHIYEAQAWNYNEFERADILYKARRPLTSDVAEELIRRAGEIGILRLVNDSSMVMTDQARIWVRARIGGREVAVNNAYLGGEKYLGPDGSNSLGDVYVQLRILLLRELFGIKDPAGSGK